jgi:hypothetical protein
MTIAHWHCLISLAAKAIEALWEEPEASFKTV